MALLYNSVFSSPQPSRKAFSYSSTCNPKLVFYFDNMEKN